MAIDEAICMIEDAIEYTRMTYPDDTSAHYVNIEALETILEKVKNENRQ